MPCGERFCFLLNLLLGLTNQLMSGRKMIKKTRPSLYKPVDTSDLKPTRFCPEAPRAACAVSLPAAAQAARGASRKRSPAGNTGNTFLSLHHFREIIESETYQDLERKRKFFETEASTYDPANALVIADWITLTFVEQEPQFARSILSTLYDLLYEAGISVIGRDRGLYNYESSAQLKLLADVGLDVSIGNIAFSDRQGIMLELSGRGCEQIRPYFRDLYVLARTFNARITRLDLALDLDSDYCLFSGFTVPKEGALANAGLYASRFSNAAKKQTLNTVGAWNDLIFGGVSVDDYSPIHHAHGGLTLYVGASTSENQIVLYEKGKQLMGNIPENDLKQIMSDYTRVSERKRNAMINKGFDPYYMDKLSWVRVERRIRRGGNKKDINHLFLLDPDSAFCLDFPRLEEIYGKYATYVQHKIDVREYRANRAANLKNILVSGKIFWAKRQYGRLVKTLLSDGLTADQVCSVLARDAGLKEYVFDIADDDKIKPLPAEDFEFEDYLTNQERNDVSAIRADYIANSNDAFSYRKNPLYTRLVDARVAMARED